MIEKITEQPHYNVNEDNVKENNKKPNIVTNEFQRKVSKIRHNVIIQGSYRCLFSFFEKLGKLTLSLSVNLLSYNLRSKKIKIEREWLCSQMSKFNLYDHFDEISELLKEDNSSLQPYIYQPFESNPDQEVLLSQVWPTSPWLEMEGMEYYICFVDPSILSPFRSDHYNEDLISEFVTITGDWFRWVREKTEQRDGILNNTHFDHNKVVEKMRDCCIRPVHPRDFLKITDCIISSELSLKEKMKQIEEIKNICCPSDNSPCNCHGAPSDSGQCIAIKNRPELQEKIVLLSGLVHWSTGFWESTSTSEMDEASWINCRKIAINALCQCEVLFKKASNLHSATEDTYIKHFLSNAINKLIYKNRNERNDEQRRPFLYRCHAQLAKLSIKIVCEDSWSPQYIYSLIISLSEYCYRSWKVPVRLDIESHLRQAIRSEPALHSLKPFYRDHFLHAVEVCLMGDALLNSKISHEEKLLDRILSHCRGKHAPKEEKGLQCQWWVTALLHDVGYGAELLKSAEEMLSFFKSHEGIDKFIREIHNSRSELTRQLRMFCELKNIPYLGSDHGVVCAAHLKETLERIGGGPLVDEFSGALRAIAFHNTRYPRVDANEDPLAALLILCDSVQSWRRASLGFGDAPAIILTSLYSDDIKTHRFQNDPVNQFEFNIKDNKIWKDSGCLRITLQYDESVNKNSGVFFLWMDTVYNLQRIDIRSLNLDIELILETPQYRSLKSQKPELQINRLEDCMMEVGIPFISEWIDHARRKNGSSAIEHEELQSTKRERLTIKMRNLSDTFKNKRPLLGGQLTDFFDRLRMWSRYSEDRDMVDDSRIRRPV